MDIDCNMLFLLVQEGGRHAEPIRLVKTRHLQGKCCGLHERVHRLFVLTLRVSFGLVWFGHSSVPVLKPN